MTIKQKFLNKFNEVLVKNIEKLDQNGDLDLELIVVARLSANNIAVDAEFSFDESPSSVNCCDVLSVKFSVGKIYNFITDYHLNGDCELSFSNFGTGDIDEDFYLEEYGENEALIWNNENVLESLKDFFFDFHFLKLSKSGNEPIYESEQEKSDMEELMRLASEFKNSEEQRMSKEYLKINPSLFEGNEALKLKNAHKNLSSLIISPTTMDVSEINRVDCKEYLIDLNEKIDKIEAVNITNISEQLKPLEERILLKIKEISQQIEVFKDVVFSNEMHCDYIYENSKLFTSPNFIFPASYQNIDVKINVFGQFYQARNLTINDFYPVACCIGEVNEDFYYDKDGVYTECLYGEGYGLIEKHPLLENVHDNISKLNSKIEKDLELVDWMNYYLKLSNVYEDTKYNSYFFEQNPDFKEVIERFQNVNFIPKIIHLKNGHSYHDYTV